MSSLLDRIKKIRSTIQKMQRTGKRQCLTSRQRVQPLAFKDHSFALQIFQRISSFHGNSILLDRQASGTVTIEQQSQY